MLEMDQEKRSASPDAEAMLRWLDSMPAWECADCCEPMRGAPPKHRRCPACEKVVRLKALLSAPREDIFKRTRVPHNLRREPPWQEDSWPRDPRPAAARINPATDWPRLASLVEVRQKSVLLRGANDVGKSHRAADLIVRLHRQGVTGAIWIREAELIRERRETPAWDPSPLWHAARKTRVLVLDDLLSFRGGPAAREEALGMILELVDARIGNPALVTIYTTHRGMSKAAAGDASIEAIAPAVYGRLLEGLVLDFGEGPGHRGTWATERGGQA
jgi:hypothetical protein